MSEDLSPRKRSIELDLGKEAVRITKKNKKKEAIRNLSGAAFIGDNVYLADDEGRRLLHLQLGERDRYGNAQAVMIDTLFDIANEADEDGEFDLEALAVDRLDKDRTRLWLIGSHAMGHEEPKGGGLKLLGLQRERNRLIFGCVDVGQDGLTAGSGRHLRIKPIRATYTTDFLTALRAAQPAADGLLLEVSALANWDIPANAGAHIGWFTPYTLASTKENGLDVEGLAIRRREGDASSVVAFIGLRGPVIDGHAVLIEVAIRDHDDDKRALDLVGKPRFHLIDLGGFGVRDLEWRGDDLLILAGPTMTRQSESALFRWNEAWQAIGAGDEPSVVDAGAIELVGSLPMTPDEGAPEVIATAPGAPQLMLLRDGIKGPRLVNRKGKASAEGPVYRAELYRFAD